MSIEELRDLDREIAELQGYDVADGSYVRGNPEKGGITRVVGRALQMKKKGQPSWFYTDVPHYTTDMRAAITLMLEMMSLNPFLGFSAHHTRLWEYTWYCVDTKMTQVTAETPELAIVKAWLQWKDTIDSNNMKHQSVVANTGMS